MPKRTDKQCNAIVPQVAFRCDLMPKRTDKQCHTEIYIFILGCDLMPKRTDKQCISHPWHSFQVVIWCQNGLTNNIFQKNGNWLVLWFDAKTDWQTMMEHGLYLHKLLWFDAKTDWQTINFNSIPLLKCCDLMPKRTDKQCYRSMYNSSHVVIWCQNGLTNNTVEFYIIKLLVVIWCQNGLTNNGTIAIHKGVYVVIWCQNGLTNNRQIRE